MQKLLISTICIASLAITSCSIGNIAWVHRIDVQQGNVITQEQVNELKPGMSPDQVRYLLGTPSLADSFHNNRWDYHYELHEGSGATSQQRLTLFFQDNQLAQIQGDLRPIPDQQPVPLEQRYPTVVVPPRQEELGFLEILWRKMGFGDTQ